MPPLLASRVCREPGRELVAKTGEAVGRALLEGWRRVEAPAGVALRLVTADAVWE